MESWEPYQSFDAPKVEPTPRPEVCPFCKKNKYLVWTYCPYTRDIYNEFKFFWFCSQIVS